jgi:hypothetical protein
MGAQGYRYVAKGAIGSYVEYQDRHHTRTKPEKPTLNIRRANPQGIGEHAVQDSRAQN